VERFRPVCTIAQATVLLLAPAVATAAEPEAPLATLGAEVIREADFRRYLERAYSPEEAQNIRQRNSERKKALEAYLDSLSLVAKARQSGIHREVRFKKALELMELKALAHLMAERHRGRVLRRIQVSPAEVKAYYERHKAELAIEPRFTARHLLVYVRGNPAFPEKGLGDAEARAKAEAALAELGAGKSWDSVVKAYSDEVATGQKPGLIRDGQFGLFAPEVERAVRSQELGRPGGVIRSAFGYHVLQVEARVTERTPRPFEEIQAMLAERLSEERSALARKELMAPIAREVGFRLREAGKRDALLFDEKAVAPGEVLADVAGRPVLESDFQWFIKDALLPRQRAAAASRPGARQRMLSSFLDMRVLEAKARRDGMDRTPSFLRDRLAMEEELLSEFMLARDGAGPIRSCGPKDEARRLGERAYLDRVRSEVGLRLAGGSL
jgi:hypothetical protein